MHSIAASRIFNSAEHGLAIRRQPHSPYIFIANIYVSSGPRRLPSNGNRFCIQRSCAAIRDSFFSHTVFAWITIGSSGDVSPRTLYVYITSDSINIYCGFSLPEILSICHSISVSLLFYHIPWIAWHIEPSAYDGDGDAILFICLHTTQVRR